MLNQRSVPRRATRRLGGFSLIELMVVIVMSTIMLAFGFSGLRQAQTSGNSRGLATAVAAELQLAREKAIAKGSPVAVVFKQGVSRSLFILEGETEPAVTRAVNYSGDYPDGAITVATYSGPHFGPRPDVPGSKALAWEARLNNWLPDEYEKDNVFMFIPNGTVVTNDLPSADGGYRVIVSTGAEVDGRALRAAGEPQTIAISQSGAVETFGRLLGYDGADGVSMAGARSPAVTPPPAPSTEYNPEAPTIFKSRVTPPAEMVDGSMAYVLDKGEYLTLEIFAHSSDGRPLYSGWKDVPLTKASAPDISIYKGAFSVPGGEPERMEFYPEYNVAAPGEPDDIKTNVWRSVWTWTPPAAAEAGDNYDLTVDVTDAKKTERAVIPALDPVVISPPGEILFESDRPSPWSGYWHLYTMLSNGKRTVRLTSGPHHHRCASATADGNLVAYERDGHEVWVMNIDGTGPVRITDNGYCPTISPAGNTVAFMRGDDVIVRRLDSSASSPLVLGSKRTAVIGAPSPSNRIAYSPDGKWVYYTAPSGDRVAGTNLSFAGNGLSLVETCVPPLAVPNTAHEPQVGGLFSGRHGQVYYHADNTDPYIGRYETGGGRPQAAASSYRQSVSQRETFPAISPNEDLLLYCEQVGGKYQIIRTAADGPGWINAGFGTAITSQGENLRPAWIRQEKGF